MTRFTGKTYISAQGLEELASLRAGLSDPPLEASSEYALPPIRMLARLPSEECGCPEELWHIEGVILLIHMEDEGKQSDMFLFAGDWEKEISVDAENLNELRAKGFQWFSDVMAGKA